MFTTVVFDFDGTLVDSNAIKRQGFFDVVAQDPQGVPRMEATLARVRGDRRAVFAAYAEAAGPAGAMRGAEALARAYSEHVDAAVTRAPEMPGASALLQRLRAGGLRLFLSSATPLDSLLRIVEGRGWRAWFDGVHGRPAQKPATLREIARATGSAPPAIAVVGDGQDDLDSADALGCAFFAVGEGRAVRRGERVWTLPELAEVLAPEPVRAP